MTKPRFLEIIGTDNRTYHVNVDQILYFHAFEKKSALFTEIVFSNKESIQSEETPAELQQRIAGLGAD